LALATEVTIKIKWYSHAELDLELSLVFLVHRPTGDTFSINKLSVALFDGMENVSESVGTPWPFDYEEPPKFLPYWFERVDTFYWKEVMIQNPRVGWYAIAAYLTLIFSLQVEKSSSYNLELSTNLTTPTLRPT
jgi:hypothetical protein